MPMLTNRKFVERRYRLQIGCDLTHSILLYLKLVCFPARSPLPSRYWETIADKLSKAGWSWGCVSAIDSEGRTIWIADANRDDGRRFVSRADDKLTAFLELARMISTHLLTKDC